MENNADLVHEFLALRRLAVVGMSRREKDFTRLVCRSLEKHGYDLVYVHPQAPEIAGKPCFARMQEVTPPVTGALLFTAPEVTATVVRDCAAAGVTQIWMHRGAGPGAVHPEAVAFCRAHGIAVIAGACPLMFLGDAGFVHRVHGWFARERILRRACAPEAPGRPAGG